MGTGQPRPDRGRKWARQSLAVLSVSFYFDPASSRSNKFVNCNKMFQSPAVIVDKMMMSLMEIAVIFDTRQLLQIEHQRSSVRIVRQEIRFQLLILMLQKMLPGWDTDN